LKLDIDDLGRMGLNHTTPHVKVVDSDALRLLILRLDLEASPKVILVDDLDLLGLRVLEEAVVELQILIRLNAYLWHYALGFDGHGKHVLTYAFKVDDQDHIVDVRNTGDELDDDLSLAVLG